MPIRVTSYGLPGPSAFGGPPAPAAPAERVDWQQWRVLVRASLRNDLRRVGKTIGLARGGSAIGLVGFIAFQALIGGAISVPLWLAPEDPFPGAVLHFTYLILSVASLLLLDATTLIVGPADYEVVASRPVSSGTFFLARAATMLVYVAFVAGAQSLVPIAAYFLAGGLHVVRGVSGAVGTLAVGFATAGIVVTLYGTVARAIPRRHLRLGLTVLQLVFSFALYGTLVMLPSRVGRAYLLDPIADRPRWLGLVPSALAAEIVTPDVSWWVIVSMVVAPVLAWAAAARVLSLDYAAQVATLQALPSPAAPPRARRWFRGGENHAVALLARAQFRDDMRFRMTVLSIVPLTVIYLLIGLVDEDLSSGRYGHPAMIYVAVLLFPGIVRGAFSRSDAYRAAWLFYASPASAGRLLLGLKNVIAVWFLVPYSLAVGALLIVVLPSVPEAALSTLLPPLCGHLLLLGLLLLDPALPFSRPPEVAANTRSMLLLILPAMFLGQLLPAILSGLAARPAMALLSLVVLLAANVGMESLLRRRVDRLASEAEFSL